MDAVKLRAWRNARDLTRRAAADVLGVNLRTLEGLETGRHPTSPLWGVLAKLTSALADAEVSPW